jgi:hypothetical protein
MAFPIPFNEPQRLAALRALEILDTGPESPTTKSPDWRRRLVRQSGADRLPAGTGFLPNNERPAELALQRCVHQCGGLSLTLTDLEL